MKCEDMKDAIKKIVNCKTTPALTKITSLLHRLNNKNKCLPKEYFLLLSELGKCTPISVLLPSDDDLEYKLLEMYLAQEFDVFSEYKTTKVMTNSFPVVTKICQKVLKYENLKFLPEDVTAILEDMILLKNRYNVLAREITVPRKKPDGKSAESQVYPLFPVHTVKNVHSADKKPDKT